MRIGKLRGGQYYVVTSSAVDNIIDIVSSQTCFNEDLNEWYSSIEFKFERLSYSKISCPHFDIPEVDGKAMYDMGELGKALYIIWSNRRNGGTMVIITDFYPNLNYFTRKDDYNITEWREHGNHTIYNYNKTKINMKKTIRLTESKLRRLIESTINELDWKTYMNAAKKNADEYSDYDFDDDEGRRKNLRTDSFVDAARKAYRDKYGSNTETDYDSYDLGYGRGHGKHNYETTYGEPYWEEYGDDDENGRWIQGRTRTEFTNDYDGEFGKDFPDVSTRYEEDDDDSLYGYDRNVSNYSDDEMPDEWNDVANYVSGKSKYVKGKGWTNESRRRMVNNLTESVIRRLRRR